MHVTPRLGCRKETTAVSFAKGGGVVFRIRSESPLFPPERENISHSALTLSASLPHQVRVAHGPLLTGESEPPTEAVNLSPGSESLLESRVRLVA